MIREVYVELFRGIRGCEKPIRLARFNLLIGLNNSGKTSLLEALFIAPYPYLSKDLPIIDIDKRKVFEYLHGYALTYRYANNALIKCMLEKGNVLKVELEPERVKSIMVDGRQLSTTSDVDFVKALYGEYSDDLSRALRCYSIFIPNSDVFIRDLIHGEVRYWEFIEATGAHVRVIRRFLSKVIHDVLTEVTLKRSQLVVRKELPDGDVAYIDLRDQGDGVERFLVAALWLEAIKPRLVLWDDLEAASHPSLIEALLQWLTEHEWQVVASTHSIDVLREVVHLAPHDAMIIALKKDPDDILHYRTYTIDEVADLMDKGLDPRKIMEW